MISYFLNMVSSNAVNFFIAEEEIIPETASESHLIPVIFITGFIISLIAIYFLRKRFGKKKTGIKLKKKGR